MSEKRTAGAKRRPRPRSDGRPPAQKAEPATRALSPFSRTHRKRRVLKTSELIAREIIMDIAEGGLKRGDTLPPEASMLQQYEVGRASLREALRLLEVNGLVYIRSGAKGGPVVGAATSEHLARMLSLYFGLAGATYEQLTEVMLILYPLVAEVTARRKLGKAESEALRTAVDLACRTPNPSMIRTETLKDFHTQLAEYSNNVVWGLLADAVGLIFADHIIATTDSSAFHAPSIADHKEIADAVLARNPRAAAAAMYAHTQRMIKFYRGQNPAIFSQIIKWQ